MGQSGVWGGAIPLNANPCSHRCSGWPLCPCGRAINPAPQGSQQPVGADADRTGNGDPR